MHHSLFSSRLMAAFKIFLLIVVATSLVSTTGCSWFKRKKPQQAVTVGSAETETQTTTPPDTAPPGDNSAEGPRPGELQPLPELQVIYFDYDKSDLRRDQLARAEGNLSYLKANPDVKVMIQGHTDERGTVEYNFALGERRAAAVRDYYIKGGITEDRLAILSKGEEEPVSAGHSDSDWSQNRRASFMRMF